LTVQTYRADLHIHTCLSPCGDLDMSPRNIVAAADRMNLDLIAVCDHNTAENLAATFRAAKRTGGRPKVLAGMEICTVEEVHVLALFDTCEQALDMQKLVFGHLPAGTNRPEIFGEQVIANEDDEVEGFVDRLLISATGLDINSVVKAVHERGGLAVASHVDRPAYGLYSQLGFLPPDLELDALEISTRCDVEAFIGRHPELRNKAILRGSDAHFPQEIGLGWTEFIMADLTIKEISLALRGLENRSIGRIS
jgi:PHP family Zn ribbon phosphoesterase